MAKITTIPMIEDGKAFSATNEYLGDRKVKATFAIRRNESEPRFRKEIELDFSKVSDEQLIQLTMYGVKVRIQSLLRAMPAETMLHPDTLAKVDVLADIIDAPSKASDPLTGAVRSLMKTGLSETEAMAVLEVAHRKAEARKSEGKKVAQAA